MNTLTVVRFSQDVKPKPSCSTLLPQPALDAEIVNGKLQQPCWVKILQYNKNFFYSICQNRFLSKVMFAVIIHMKQMEMHH
jgi:hypothetical protein